MSIFTALFHKFTSWSYQTLHEGKLINRYTDDHLTNNLYDYQGITKSDHLILLTHKTPCNKFIIGKDSFNRIYYFDKYGKCITTIIKGKFIDPTNQLDLKTIKRYKYNELQSMMNNSVK